MSRYGRPLKILAVIVAVIIGGALVLLAAVVIIYFSHGDVVRSRLARQFKTVQLIPGVQYQGKTSVGDPIDSPDQYGYDYTYSTRLNQTDVLQSLRASLKQQGFAIHDAADSNGTYFKADDRAKNLSLEVDYSPGIVHIISSEYKHE